LAESVVISAAFLLVCFVGCCIMRTGLGREASRGARLLGTLGVLLPVVYGFLLLTLVMEFIAEFR
jgi:hypothetical protein